jgi:predicted nucleotidyltransferase
MPSAPAATRSDLAHPVLARVKEILRARYGDRLLRVILYGSRARGDARPESDWDIAVVLKGHDGSIGETLALSDAMSDLLLETGEEVSAKVFSPEEIEARTIFMHHLREDGVDL